MPSVLSKVWNTVFMTDWVFDYNCYEIGHTWTEHCSDAATDMGMICFREGLKMYSGLYLASHLIFSRKLSLDLKSLSQIGSSAIRSSAFLGFNAFAVFVTFCALREMTGRFYYSLCVALPGFIGSFAAIWIERPTRRAALAVYCANIASECLFKIGVRRGWWRSIAGGEVALFTVSISALLYLVKRNGYGQDPVSLALRFLLGSEEAKVRKRGALSSENEGSSSCPHSKSVQSCAQYAALGSVRPFLVGLVGQGLFAAAASYRQNAKAGGTVLRLLLNKLFSSRSLRFGAFLGLFSGIFKAVSCAQRQSSGNNHDWHALVAGLVAGPTMALSPNSTMTLYVLWKALEASYCTANQAGLMPLPDLTIATLYAASVSVIFYTVIMEPACLRGSYMKFLDRCSDHRLHQLNRNLLDIFGTGASAGYEDFWPNLHPGLCSRKFLESVLIWVI